MKLPNLRSSVDRVVKQVSSKLPEKQMPKADPKRVTDAFEARRPSGPDLNPAAVAADARAGAKTFRVGFGQAVASLPGTPKVARRHRRRTRTHTSRRLVAAHRRRRHKRVKASRPSRLHRTRTQRRRIWRHSLAKQKATLTARVDRAATSVKDAAKVLHGRLPARD